MTSSLDTDGALALVRQGWDQIQHQRPLAAWAAWQRALRFVPDFPAATEALATFQSVAELPLTARAVLRFQTPRDPDRRARWDRAFHGSDLEELDAAAAAFASLASVDSTDADASYNEGLCFAWLGRNLEAIRALDRAVRLWAGDDFDRAVAAWTLGEILRQGAGAETLADDLRYIWIIEGADHGIVTRLAGRFPLVPASVPSDPVTEPLKGGVEIWEWLDRPLPPPNADLASVADLPRLLATVVWTPRELRLSSPDPQSLDAIHEELILLLGDHASPIRREAIPLPLTLLDAALWRFRFPPLVDREIKERLTREAVESAYEDRWIHVPRHGLDDCSPLEASRLAVDDLVVRARLMAVVRLREQLGDRPATAALYQGYPFDRLRRRLGLEPNAAASLDLEDASCMSEVELDRLDPATLDDVRLADACASAAGLRVDERTIRFAVELLRRETPCLIRLDLASLIAPLVRQALSDGRPEQAIAWLDRALELETGGARRTFTIWRAEVFARSGNPDAAVRAYGEILEAHPSDFVLALDAAHTLIDHGYEEQARPLLLHARDQARLAGDEETADRAQAWAAEVQS